MMIKTNKQIKYNYKLINCKILICLASQICVQTTFAFVPTFSQNTKKYCQKTNQNSKTRKRK